MIRQWTKILKDDEQNNPIFRLDNQLKSCDVIKVTKIFEQTNEIPDEFMKL